MPRSRFLRLTLLPAGLLAAGHMYAQRAPARVRAVLPAYRTPIALDTIMQRTTFQASAGAVWKAAEKVFYDLKISTDTRDSSQGVIGVTKLNKSGVMAGQPMSRLFNCGLDMTGPKADIYRISVVLMAIVTPQAEGKAELGVAFIGSGLDVRGSSSDPVACAPTGVMEKKFADDVAKILTPAPESLKKP